MTDFDVIPSLLQLLNAEKTIETAMAVDISIKENWLGQWQFCHLDELVHMPFVQRYDLALVNLIAYQSLPEKIDYSLVNNALVKLRDLLAKKIVVLTSKSTQHDEMAKNLRALGFNYLLDIEQQIQASKSVNLATIPVDIWQFNILTYKHVPDWFNSKFWASPENWDKYRW